MPRTSVDLELRALGPRRVVVQWVSPSTPRRKSLGSCGYVGLVLLRWMQAVCRCTPHWSEAFGDTMRWLWVLASVFSPSTDNRVCWFLRFIVFVLGGLLRWILAEYRHTLPSIIGRLKTVGAELGHEFVRDKLVKSLSRTNETVRASRAKGPCWSEPCRLVQMDSGRESPHLSFERSI